jgi:hypothetical protein
MGSFEPLVRAVVMMCIILARTSSCSRGPCSGWRSARPVVVRDEPVNDASVAVAVDATDAGGEIAIPVGTMGPGDWSPRVSPWHCPCNSKEAWGGKTVCPQHARTCTRSQVEKELRCGFTRYTCGEYVVVRLPSENRALDEPLVGAAFGVKSGKLVAVAEWDGYFVSGSRVPATAPSVSPSPISTPARR